MRCTLALCVILTIGGSAWSAEQAPVSTGSVVQTPAVSIPAPAPTTTGMIPTTPAPTIGSPATTTVGTQPMMTSPNGNMTYYPGNYGYRRGLFGRTYATYTMVPGQTVYTTTTYPAQATYTPVRRGLFGLGLFQGRRRQAYPMYTTSAPTTTGYYYPGSNDNFAAPAGTVPSTASTPAGSTPVGTTPTYTETQFQAPTGTTSGGAAPATTLPRVTTPTTTTPPSPPIPQIRTPGGTL